VRVSDLELVPDGKDAAADAVLSLGQDRVAEEGLDGVVDAEAGLGPGEDAEEDAVLGEEGDVSVELFADVDWSERAEKGVSGFPGTRLKWWVLLTRE